MTFQIREFRFPFHTYRPKH